MFDKIEELVDEHSRLEGKANKILSTLFELLAGQTQQSQEMKRMSQVLDQIQAAQANEDTLIGQAAALVSGIPAATAAAIAAAEAGDAAEAASILADMTAQSNTLSAALAAATPATTTPAPAVAIPAAPASTPASS